MKSKTLISKITKIYKNFDISFDGSDAYHFYVNNDKFDYFMSIDSNEIIVYCPEICAGFAGSIGFIHVKAVFSINESLNYDEIIKHFLGTKTTGKEGCQKPKPATNP